MKIFRKQAALCAAGVIAFSAAAGCRSPRFGNTMSKSDEIQLGQQASVDVEKQAKIITSGPAVRGPAARRGPHYPACPQRLRRSLFSQTH